MTPPTPEAKRAVQMIMREFQHASEFVMEQHVQQALDAITDKALTLFGKSLAEKDKVIEGLKAALSSNLCSEHQTPDPLNCDTCNKVTSLTGANLERMTMIDSLQAQLDEAQQATADLHKEFISVVKERDEARGEVETGRILQQEIQASIYAPGIWVCPKCSYTLFKNILYARSGNVGTDLANEVEPCPNDGVTTMRRVTWQERATDLGAIGEQLLNRATQAEKARDELVGLVNGKIQGKSLRDYLTQQFPATIGHILLRQYFDQLDTLLARIDAKGEK